ncbi:MAG TPA: efflux RND transporter periplasmic adaptor subunit [Planctomycetota bacterium]|nr:efflux RND transporter periplasmic adaptor subunit [Planctomycetota bacterium]
MKWQRNAALAALIAVAAALGLLFSMGKLHVRWGEAKSGAGHDGHEDEEGEHPDEASRVVGNRVTLDVDIALATGIAATPAVKGAVATNLRATGEVQFAEGRVAHVTSRVPGAIREVSKTLGDEVSAGTPLCTIESVELGEARAKFVSALSERTLAERNHGRWKELFEKGLKTQNELWSAENTFTRAKLDSEAAMGKLKALGIPEEEIAELEKGTAQTITNRYQVKSPISGTVLERHATLGENVEPNDQIFLVADLSELWVEAAVYVKDLSRVRTGMTGVVRIQGFPDTAFKGSVRYVGQRVDEKTRMAPLWITIKSEAVRVPEQKQPLRPGMFVTVDLELSRKEDVLVVPLDAVQTVAGETVVFVQQGPPSNEGAGAEAKAGAPPRTVTFDRRRVELGVRDGGVAEVLRGLEAGELVVVGNAYLLKSEFEKSRIGEGHSH